MSSHQACKGGKSKEIWKMLAISTMRCSEGSPDRLLLCQHGMFWSFENLMQKSTLAIRCPVPIFYFPLKRPSQRAASLKDITHSTVFSSLDNGNLAALHCNGRQPLWKRHSASLRRLTKENVVQNCLWLGRRKNTSTYFEWIWKINICCSGLSKSCRRKKALLLRPSLR